MKRGQVTLFAIMGFILVIFFLFATSTVLDSNEAKDYAMKQEFILHDYNEGLVRNDVSNCIENSQKDAIMLLGANAGYFGVSQTQKYNDQAPGNTYDGAVVMMDVGGTYFLNDESFSSKICNKIYVDVQTCIDKVQFENDGFLVETNVFNNNFLDIPLYCKAVLRSNSVVVSTNYPVKFSKEELSFEVSQFWIETQSKIKLANQYAQLIASEARNDDYLGNFTYDVSQRCSLFPDFSVDISDRVVILKEKNSLNSAMPNFVYKFAILDYNITGSCN